MMQVFLEKQIFCDYKRPYYGCQKNNKSPTFQTTYLADIANAVSAQNGGIYDE